jgi:hypothetical protein
MAPHTQLDSGEAPRPRRPKFPPTILMRSLLLLGALAGFAIALVGCGDQAEDAADGPKATLRIEQRFVGDAFYVEGSCGRLRGIEAIHAREPGSSCGTRHGKGEREADHDCD